MPITSAEVSNVSTASGFSVAPAVSIVTPFHNRASLLPAILQTLAQQTFREFELIVVDDGSEDDLGPIVEKVRTAFPLRMIRLSRNLGAASARNVGLEAAEGRYVAFLDSDDSWHPEKLRRQFDHLNRASDGGRLVSLTRQLVVGARTYVTPRRLARRNDSVGRYLFQCGGVIQSSMIFLPTGLARSARFADGARGHDDWSFALRLENVGARFEMLPEVLTIYNDEQGRARRSPEYSEKRFEWLQQSRQQLGEAPYLAARAAFASRMGARRSFDLFRMIVVACVRGAISPWRAGYYAASFAFPSFRTACVRAKEIWLSLRLPRGPGRPGKSRFRPIVR
ncbi:MAG TPA: glycosyltransferase family 2 protein [Pseudolabrys sp.]|nr:glycosyltransferase family 2 protein [Pseudolabrys sp.]